MIFLKRQEATIGNGWTSCQRLQELWENILDLFINNWSNTIESIEVV